MRLLERNKRKIKDRVGKFVTLGSLLAAAFMLLGYSPNVSAQWSGTTNIYYNGGNVGIGTSTPGVKLEVSGTPTTSGNLFKFSGADSYGNLFNEIASTGTGGAILKLSGGSGTSFNLQSTGSGSGPGNNKFVIGTASSALFSLQSDGNVGIGTTAPIVKLDVTGAGVSMGGTWAVNTAFVQDHTSYRGGYLGHDTASQVGIIAATT